MNEGRWSSDSDLQDEAGSSRVPDWNQHQIRMLKEMQGGHASLHLHDDLHHDLTNNNRAGEDEQDEEEADDVDGVSKLEEEDEEMESISGACSPELLRDSSSLSCSPSVCEGPLSPEEVPVGVFLPDLSRCVSESLRVLVERGEDAALPHRLHQIAELLMQEEDYERAIHFLQLESLYHERVLANIATLQETWESRWRCSKTVDNSIPHCNLNSEHLDRLKHICMTHRQPTWNSNTCKLVHRISVNGESCGEKYITSESPCSTQSEMLEADDEGGISHSESSTDCLAHQRAPSHLTDSASIPPTSSSQAPPTLVMTESSLLSSVRVEAEEQHEREQKGETEKEQETDGIPQEAGKEAEPGETEKEAEPGGMEKEAEPGGSGKEAELRGSGKEAELGGSGKEVEPGQGRMDLDAEKGRTDAEPAETATKKDQIIKLGGAETSSQTGVEKPEDEEEIEEEEIEEAVEALELEAERQRTEDAMLDDLAKRIQVEEITPASGLVSILKRRMSDREDENSSTSKPVTKRRVRFHVPEDGLEQDEVGGDSWLLLLLLCLVTVVISVGGTALYCAFGDAHSSVCTDFSHNIDFYMGKVQSSVEDITHFFSSSS